MRKRLLFLLKYAVALLLVAWVLSQVDRSAMQNVFARLSAFEIALAALLFNLGQCTGSERMRYYYRHAGFTLSRGFALRLTYVSMFYNMLVPGGIGGDAYRVALLKKQQGVPIGLGVRLQLSGRVSGLVAICLLMAVLFLFSSVALEGMLLLGVPLGLLMLLGGYALLLLPLLKESPRVAMGAFCWSLLAQALALAGVAALAAGLGASGGHAVDYLLLYLVAALAGMLPITIGGLGIREFTFFYGAHWMERLGGSDLHPELGVALALACFGITLLSSLLGLLWVGRVGVAGLTRPKEA